MDKINNSSNQIVRLLCLLIAVVAFVRPAESCHGANLISTGITQAQKYEILEAHNRLRSQVAQGQVAGQPGAQNMREMVWDDELAARAQQWANQCIFEHDPSRYTNRFTMGQNLAIIWSTAPLAADDATFSSRIQNWFNEVRQYAWGSSWAPKTGHYSQLVWGETNLVGCGFSYYKDARRWNKLYVCNYGPGGNVIGSAPYAVGQPSCTSHGMYPSSKYTGLCVSTQKFYGANNNIITQNTYTLRSERLRPTVYQTVKPAARTTAPATTTTTTATTATNTYRRYTPPQSNAIQAYRLALRAYQNSADQSYETAQRNYQLALQAYAAAYPTAPATTYSYKNNNQAYYG